MTRYAHARPGETCTRCNDYASRVVGTQPLCVDHFDLLVGAIHRRQRWKITTPPTSPADGPQWRQTLTEAADLGIITIDDAKAAWTNWKTQTTA